MLLTRRTVSNVPLVIATSVAAAIALAYVGTRRGAALAAAAVILPSIALWIVQRRGNGLFLAVTVVLVVPYWYAHVWLIAPSFALLGLAAGTSRPRLCITDVAFLAFGATLALSWGFHPELGIPLKLFIQTLLLLGFYVWPRVTLTTPLLGRLQLVLLICAGLAAVTVIFEAAHGHAVFVDPNTYQWAGSASVTFRPGGVFGGSPTAAIILAACLLASISLYPSRPRLVGATATVIVVAIALTLDRAGALGLITGGLLMALLSPYKHWGRVALGGLALGTIAFAVTTSAGTVAALSSTKIVQSGIVRSNTLNQRSALFSESLPLIDDSAAHFVFGRGFDALESRGIHDAHLAATPDLWLIHNGPNNDFVRAWLEQGLLGLVALVTWLLTSLFFGMRCCLRLTPGSRERLLVAGLTAATLAYAVGSVGHDVTHNVAALSVGSLLTGVLITACSLLDPGTRSPRRASRRGHFLDVSYPDPRRLPRTHGAATRP
jgi:O-antigen ligase